MAQHAFSARTGHRFHYREECKHGTPVGQCRCAGPKPITVVLCPSWCEHKEEQ